MATPTILVTGAAGFIASHTSEALLRRGYNVVGIDNFCPFYARSWKENNLLAIRATAQQLKTPFEFHELDIVDAAAVDRLIEQVKPTGIVHLAAMAGVRPSIERPGYYMRVNMEGTANLLQAAARHGVQRFLFASSSSVYGNFGRVPFSEEDPVTEPISPYAASKRAGELLCHSYWHLYQLPISCLRFFTVYGPRQRPDLAIHKFIRLISQDRPLQMFGDGSTSRDYTYIDDIVAGILASFDRCDRFRIYNLGGSDPVRLSDLISELESIIGKRAIINSMPMQPGDVERTYADLSRSTAELGYKPATPLPVGLTRFVEWYREFGRDYSLPGET